MSVLTCFKILLSLLFYSQTSFANHSTEGVTTLEQLVTEAENSNLELKQAKESLAATEYSYTSKKSKYWPSLSLEGGPLMTKFDSEENSGNTLYGKIDWNLYNGGADAAEIEKSKIQNAFELNKITNLRNTLSRRVELNYYDLLYIAECISLKQEAIVLNANQKKLAISKNKSGLTLSSDVIEFELRESALKADLIRLEQLRREKSQDLSLLLSRGSPNEIISPKGHLSRQKRFFQKEQLIEQIKSNDLELNQISNEIQLLNQEKAIHFSKFLPKLDLEAQYGQLANEERVFTEQTNYKVNLKISIPLFDGFESRNETQKINALNKYEKTGFEKKLLSKVAELENTLIQIKTLNSLLDIEESNLVRRESYYKMTLEEYKRGVKNSPDLVNAAERLLDTKIRNLEHRRDLEIANLKISELTNASLSKSN